MGARLSLRSDKDGRIKITSDAVNITNTISEPTDYNSLINKPSICGNELVGDKSLEQLGITKDSLDITVESLGITPESLGITPESLGITPESLGITPESIGIDSADTYDIYSLFHS